MNKRLSSAQKDSLALMGKVAFYWSACAGVGYLAGKAIVYATDILYNAIIGKDEDYSCWYAAIEELKK